MDTLFDEDSGFFSSQSEYGDELESGGSSCEDEQVTDDKGLTMVPLSQQQLLTDLQACNNRGVTQTDNFDCLYKAIHKPTVHV